MNAKTCLDIVGEEGAAIASFTSTCVSDVEEIRSASDQIREYIHENEPDQMIFDFSGVRFFSSQVLGLLLEARARLARQGGRAVVCALDGQLQRVFKITNLDRIFAFFPDRQAALHAPAVEG
jgi:anti-sigma B factor antagonist